MKKLFTAVIMFFMVSATIAQQVKSTDIIGAWEATDKTFKLDMFKDGGAYKAYLLYAKKLVESDGKTLKKDVKNPDEKLRSRSLDHIVFLTGLVWDGEQWDNGRLYDGSSGKTYKCRCRLENGQLNLRGYLGIPALGSSITLNKVK